MANKTTHNGQISFVKIHNHWFNLDLRTSYQWTSVILFMFVRNSHHLRCKKGNYVQCYGNVSIKMMQHVAWQYTIKYLFERKDVDYLEEYCSMFIVRKRCKEKCTKFVNTLLVSLLSVKNYNRSLTHSIFTTNMLMMSNLSMCEFTSLSCMLFT